MMERYEIPGFGGFTWATRTNVSKRRLCNKDAIALLIDTMVQPRGELPGDVDGRGVRIALGHWRGLRRDYKLESSFNFSMDKKFSGYFNSSDQYGYLGSGPDSTVNTVHKYSYVRDGIAVGHPYTSDIPTFWYRTRHGHYALTTLGRERVSWLREQVAELDGIALYDPQEVKDAGNREADRRVMEVLGDSGWSAPADRAVDRHVEALVDVYERPTLSVEGVYDLARIADKLPDPAAYLGGLGGINDVDRRMAMEWITKWRTDEVILAAVRPVPRDHLTVEAYCEDPIPQIRITVPVFDAHELSAPEFVKGQLHQIYMDALDDVHRRAGMSRNRCSSAPVCVPVRRVK